LASSAAVLWYGPEAAGGWPPPRSRPHNAPRIEETRKESIMLAHSFRRSAIAPLAVCVGLMVAAMTLVATADSSNPNPQVFPSRSHPFGHTYNEWSARWWQWALSIPAATNPVLDETGAHCAEGQGGQVWFLAGSFAGGTFTRACTVPPGKALFLSIVNA